MTEIKKDWRVTVEMQSLHFPTNSQKSFFLSDRDAESLAIHIKHLLEQD